MVSAARSPLGRDKGSTAAREAVYLFVDWREPIFRTVSDIHIMVEKNWTGE